MDELTTENMKYAMRHISENEILTISVKTKDGKEIKLKKDLFISYDKNKITFYEM